MFSIVIAIIFFLVCVVCHVLLHRLFVRWRIPALLSASVYLVGLIIMGTMFFPSTSGKSVSEAAYNLWTIPLPLTAFVLFALLSCFHFVFYTSPLLGDRSPSSRLLLFVEKKGALDYREIKKYFADTPLIAKRLDDLVAARWIERVGKRYRLLPTGVLLTRVLESYRTFIGWHSSG